jgi:hypothetical protein
VVAIRADFRIRATTFTLACRTHDIENLYVVDSSFFPYFAASAIATLIHYLRQFVSYEVKKMEITVEVDGEKVTLIASKAEELEKILAIIRKSNEVAIIALLMMLMS